MPAPGEAIEGRLGFLGQGSLGRPVGESFEYPPCLRRADGFEHLHDAEGAEPIGRRRPHGKRPQKAPQKRMILNA